jgi:pilus assembly protein CpaB
MPAGTVLTAGDVRLDRVPTSTVPDEVLADSEAVMGKSLAGPVPKGQMLTTLNLLSLRSQVSGAVVSPVRLADAQVAALITVGERIDVIVTGSQGESARTVATNVRVVGLPKLPAASGLTDGDGAGDALVLVEVDPRTATLLADAGAGGRLSVALH